MRIKGLEPPRLSASDPKSDVATNYTISAGFGDKDRCFFGFWQIFITFVFNYWEFNSNCDIMKRLFTCLALLAAMFVGAQSAEAKVRSWEAEVGVGATTATNKLQFDKNTVGWNVLGEVRRNFGVLPIDLGLRVDGNVFSRKYEALDDVLKTQFSSVNAMALADLNLFREKKLSLFVGLGLGYGWLSQEPIKGEKIDGIIDAVDTYKVARETSSFVCMPRVGIEICHHVRATLYYKVYAASKEYKDLAAGQGHFGLSLGFVLGGGAKE